MFDTFECWDQNLSNSLWQLWNDKAISLQILYPSSVSQKITLLYFFSSNNIYFLQKETIKVNFWDFWILKTKFVKFLMLTLKRQVDSSPNFPSLLSFMKENPSVLFLVQTTYTLLKRNPLKWKILRHSSARVKIRQIPHVNFKMTSLFLFRFCVIVHCQDR